MPTYQITVKQNLLSDTQKDDIAEYLTKIHTGLTGAPNYYVQIIFNETNNRRYLGGKRSDSQIWVHGDIRSGRTPETRSLLVEKIIDGIYKIASVPKNDIWVFLNNLEPSDMAIYGQLTPIPGEEEKWFKSLPNSLQNKLSHINVEN